MTDTPPDACAATDSRSHADVGNESSATATPKKKTLSLRDQSIFLVIGNVFRQGSAIIQGMILARLLTEGELGTFRQAMLISTLVYTFAYLCLPEAASYFLGRLDERGKKHFTFQVVMMLTLMGLVSGAFLALTSGGFAQMFGNDELGALLVLTALIPLGMMYRVFLVVSLVSVGRAQLSSMIAALTAFLLVLSVSIPALLGMSLAVMIGGYAVATLVSGIVALVLLIRLIGCQVSWDRNLAVEILKFSLPFAFGQAVFFLYTQIHKFIVAFAFNEEQFGFFSVGTTQLPVMTQLSAYVALVLIPPCVRHREEGHPERVVPLWEKATCKVALVICPFFAILAVSPREILSLMFSEKYAQAWPLFVLTSSLMLLKICNIQSLFKITGKTYNVVWSSLASLVVGVLSGWLLIYPLGLMGPPIGLLLAQMVQTVLSLRLVRKDLPISFVQAFAVGYALKVLAVALAGCALARLTLFWIPWNIVYVPSYALLSASLIMMGGWRLGLLSEEDKALVKRWGTLKPILERR